MLAPRDLPFSACLGWAVSPCWSDLPGVGVPEPVGEWFTDEDREGRESRGDGDGDVVADHDGSYGSGDSHDRS